MKQLSKMTKKWLVEYLSNRLDITGKETKAELLHTCKILGISENISPTTVDRIERKMKS